MDFTTLVVLCFLLYLLPIVLPRDSRIRFYSCYATCIAVTLTTCLLLLPIQILLPSIAYEVPRIVVEHLSKILGIEWDIRNREVLKKYKNPVIVNNHQSMLDFYGSIVAFSPTSKNIPVMKKELGCIFPLSQTLKFFNTVFVDRKNNTHIAKALLREKCMTHDKKLIIYPEGTRNHKGEPFLPFKKGAFRIAVELKRPVIPAVTSPYYFIKPGMFRGGKVIIKLLEPIETTDLNEEDINDLMEKTREIMEKEYSELKKEVMMNEDVKLK